MAPSEPMKASASTQKKKNPPLGGFKNVSKPGHYAPVNVSIS